MHLVSLDNSNYWQFHKILGGKVILLPTTPFNEILKRRVEFLLLRGMEGANKHQWLIPTCSSLISGNSRAWDRLSTFKGDPNTEPLQPVRIAGLDNADFSQARKAYLFQATNMPAHWPRLWGPPSCVFYPGPSASGLSHGELCPICWNRPSQAAPVVVWASSSPACCCWKEATMSVISPQPLSTCPLWGRGAHLERITSEADNLEGGGENGRRENFSGCQLGTAMF